MLHEHRSARQRERVDVFQVHRGRFDAAAEEAEVAGVMAA
jgi:hypothetical protein